MIGLILAFPFIFQTCFSEAVLECGMKNVNSPAICSQIRFDNSLKSFYDNKLEKAKEGFEEVVKSGEEPWRRRSIFMLGRIYLELGKREEARDLFLRAIPEYDVLADYSLYYFSESLLNEKDYEKATEILRLLYKTYTESPLRGLAQFKEAESFYLLGKYSESVQAFEVFLAENPKDPMASEAKLYKGKALKAAGRMEEAVEVFKRLWIEDPASASADKVKEELVTVRLNTQDYLFRTEQLFKASLYSKALSDIQKTMEIEEDPRKVNELRLMAGIALFRTRRYDEAIEVINKVLSHESGVRGQVSRDALYYVARAYLRKGDRDRSLKTSNELYRLYPEDKRGAELFMIVADELRRSGKREKALAIYNIIIKEYPEVSADAIYQRGWMEYLSGEFEKSSKEMRLLVEKHPESPRVPQALYWEARGYDKSGNASEAEVLYRRIVKEYPSNFYGYMARERLKESEDFWKLVSQKNFKSSFSNFITSSEIAFPKVRELKILGMKEEAIKELDYIRDRYSGKGQTANTSDLEILINIGETYINLDEYRKAISMAEGHSSREKRLLYLSYPLGFWPFLSQSSSETMIDPYLLAALIREESRFDPKAISRAGAKGLMQIIPSTWDWISSQKNKTELRTQNSELRNSDPFDPGENIAKGSWYLRYLLDKFNWNLIIALSAYNAGPEAVNSWIRNGIKDLDVFIEEVPYLETRAYIKRILRSYWEYKKIYNNP